MRPICPPGRASSSPDIWSPIDSVIGDWGLGEGLTLWDRIVGRNEELLRVGGLQIALWQQVSAGLECPCTKTETEQVDQRCPICYGTKFVGGFDKVGYCTLHLHSGNTAFTLSNVEYDANDNTLKLVEGATTGTILSGLYQVKDTFGFDASRLDAYDGPRLITQDRVTVEYSTDGGTTYQSVLSPSCLSQPAFIARFRITLTRPTAADYSPSFKILRVRWRAMEDPTMYISKRPFFDQRILESFGVQIGLDTTTWWTTPSVGRGDGSTIYIREGDLIEVIQGFYQNQEGVVQDYPISGRFDPATVMYIEPQGHLLSQRLNMRPLQPDEPRSFVF